MCRRAARPRGLGFVAGLEAVGRAPAPIFRPLRHPRERRVGRKMHQGPAHIADVVAGKAQFRAIRQDSGKFVQRLGLDEAAAAVARLRPGVGEKSERALNRRLFDVGQETARILRKNAYIFQSFTCDVTDQAGNAVEIGLAADEADVGMGQCLIGQVLAAAEAYFEPDLRRTEIEETAGIDRRARQWPRDRHRRQ